MWLTVANIHRGRKLQITVKLACTEFDEWLIQFLNCITFTGNGQWMSYTEIVYTAFDGQSHWLTNTKTVSLFLLLFRWLSLSCTLSTCKLWQTRPAMYNIQREIMWRRSESMALCTMVWVLYNWTPPPPSCHLNKGSIFKKRNICVLHSHYFCKDSE